MSASGSTLTPLLSTHDLKRTCPQCCIKEKEITYSLKSVQHRCARTLLLCRAKGGSKWRPVNKRPAINPRRYEVCYFFEEGRGCTQHKNRCNFARSPEEAAVWNFEKYHRLDRAFLCHLVDQSHQGSDQLNGHEPQSNIRDTLELRVACELCLIKERETTYTFRSVHHACRKQILLVKTMSSDKWRPVSKRPTLGNFGSRVQYQKCIYFVEGAGCDKHGQQCNFARSHEEAAIWNYMRDNNMDKEELISGVIQCESDLNNPKCRAETILKRFPGKFLELCKACFLGQPQRLMGKRCNAHRWDPLLVHRLSEGSDKQVYCQIRPLPPNCRFDYCSHVLEGKLCWHQPGSCTSALSHVEMAVWREEHSGISIRPLLLQLSPSEPTESTSQMYCKVCLKELPSAESFYQHCSTPEHAQLLSEDTTIQWAGRPPPHDPQGAFLMCER